MSTIHDQAPNVQLHLDAEFDRQLAERMRYQEIDFVIDYARFDEQGFSSTEIFQDELVVVASKSHPRIQDAVTAVFHDDDRDIQILTRHGP